MNTVLDKIHRAGIKFLVSLTPEETYSTIINEASKLVGAEYGSIWLEQDRQLKRVFTSASNLYNERPRKNGNLIKAFHRNEPFIGDSQSVNKAHPVFRDLNIKSITHIPLLNQQKPFGIMTIYSSHKKRFKDYEIETLKLFGDMASLAIRKTQLYDDSRKALEVRDLFISMAAHELRTPLTTISGYVDLLRSKQSRLDQTQARWVEELSWETARLNKLVRELLTVNRIRSGQLEYIWQECHLKEVISRSQHNFKMNHPHRKLVFGDKLANGKDVVIGDRDKLLQVVTNLLDNAVKFSPAKSVITLTLNFKDPHYIIEVRDEGTGMSKVEIRKVFDRFYKGSHTKEGIGLGLSLAKHIIATHHGLIDIRSKLNHGTSVLVKLPEVNL